jgi:prolyl-tRNA synthetase
LRGVEFIMKDLYSFHENQESLDRYYEKVKKAYFNIFDRCGLKKETFLTFASGGAFSKYSHEFQTITEFGEDEIYLCRKCSLAVNKEIIKEEGGRCPQCGGKNLEVKKAIEVGNIFKLKDKFSQSFGLNFQDRNGQEKPVLMGCYGIGLGRLMGAVAEIHSDEKGIIWPEPIAPFKIHLIVLNQEERKTKEAADKIYKEMEKNKIEVLYDDREKNPGEKFADADLMGIPNRVVVSRKTMDNNSVEIKERGSKKERLVKIKELTEIFNY